MRDIRTSHEETGDRSIRNIPLGRLARRITSDNSAELPHRQHRRRNKRFLMLAIAVVVVCATFGLLLSTVFAGATITVYPRALTMTLAATLQAEPNAPVGTLSYKIVTVTRSGGISVPAQGIKRVSRPATGVVTILNVYSSASQRLIANTRFEAPDGKIYRIRDSVTVPGATGIGSALKPGTVSATVYADSPGPDYNKSALTTFTIPGFKGDPRYAKFSGRSDGAIGGGFTGDEPAVAAADMASAKITLQQKIDANVRSAAAAEIPEGYIAIQGTIEVSFSDLVQTPGADLTATLTESATASSVIIRQTDLASAIAKSEVEHYKGEAVILGDTSSLEVSLATTSKRESGAITLALKGQTTLVWQFDKNALLLALAGKGKTEFQTVIEAFHPAVSKADASIRPFWQGKFPGDVNKIKIKVVGEK